MTYIYVLKLDEGKYYIGKTNNPNVRISEHFKSDGSNWTRIYKPIKIINIIPNCDNYDEDKYTLQYMQQYGIDNVRGGSFTKVILEYSQIKTINTMIKSNNDKCYKCGKKGHFVNNCSNNKNKTDSFEYYPKDDWWECDYCGKIFDTKKREDITDFKGHEHGVFKAKYADVGGKIGARQLGYNITIIPPGKKSVVL